MTFFLVFWREVRSLVVLPHTYAIAAAYLILSGVFFVNILIDTEAPDLGQYYSNVASTLIVLVPIVAMRSFAEERRTGALGLTLSLPLSRTGLALGKLAANTAFVWVLVSVAWLYVRLISGLGTVDMARAAGGYIGMLLLALAYSAVALAVSARAGSPTTAAFVGFGVLLLGWILDYAPGWIGDTLSELGPVPHFEAFSRGVVYLSDLVYFLIVTVLGAGLTVAALAQSRPGPAVRTAVRRTGAFVAAAVLLVATPTLAGEVEGEIDLTASRRNTIAPATRDVLRRVEEPIRVTAFIRPISPQATQLRNMVKQYSSAGADMEVTVVDPDAEPGRARRAGITNYNQYVLELRGRREVVDDVNQITVTGAINRLSRRGAPQACFTVGHGERDIRDKTQLGASGLAGELRKLAYDVSGVAVAGTGGAEALARCDVVVVAGPRVPFLPDELAALGDFAADEGRLVVLADAVEGPRSQLNELLRPWGVAFGDGVVSDLSALAGDPSSVVSSDYPSKSPPVVRLDQSEISVVLSNSAPVEPAVLDLESDTSVSPLVRSSEASWVSEGGDGPFILAAGVDDTRVVRDGAEPDLARTRIGVVGTAEVATNRFIDYLGNRGFLTALVQWAAQESDIVSANRDPGGFTKLVLTEADKDGLVQKGIVLPTLAALVPLPVALLRLKRG
ncbi:MAG: DUF4350 domain-containing protein [Acidimicrobiia bacterium]